MPARASIAATSEFRWDGPETKLGRWIRYEAKGPAIRLLVRRASETGYCFQSLVNPGYRNHVEEHDFIQDGGVQSVIDRALEFANSQPER